jgi:RNA polymerase sigma factor (TIGR02999 family)
MPMEISDLNVYWPRAACIEDAQLTDRVGGTCREVCGARVCPPVLRISRGSLAPSEYLGPVDSAPRPWRYAIAGRRVSKMSDVPTISDDGFGAPPGARRLADELLPLLYEDVRRLARRERRRVSAGGTMQTTALVHEAYLKLLTVARFNDRQHFLRAAALAMRHILINHARDRIAGKRGGGASHVEFDEATDVGMTEDKTLIEINDALGRLAELSPRLAQIVECRFFAGFKDEDTALALGLTDRTVRRDWVKARAWLRRELSRGADLLGAGEP